MTRQLTFSTWLASARITDDPEGDLIEDLRADRRLNGRLPPIRTLADLSGHLRNRSACREAIEAVPDVWDRYVRWLCRQ